MAFGSTPILDDFNRADSASTIGGDWSIFGRSGSYDMGISSNQAYNPDAQWNFMYYNAAQFGPDCEAYMTIATLQPQTATFELFVRLKDLTPDTYAYDGYSVSASRLNNAGTDTMRLRLRRRDNSSTTDISSPFDIPNPAAGLRIGISAVGSTIKAFYDSGGGWVEALSVTDATYGGAGYLGLYWHGESTSRIDNFGGGGTAAGGMATKALYYARMRS